MHKVKSNKKIINNYREYEKNGYPKEKIYSKEIRYMIREFKKNNWNIYLATLKNFNYDSEKWSNIYSISDDEFLDVTIDKANEIFDIFLIRVIGSIEGNFNNIKKYLTYISKKFNGLILNNPKAMLKGMTKHYLEEIDTNYLYKLGIKSIPTKIYNKDVSLNTITNNYDNLDKYIIKPVSGELSNSLFNLSNITEENLRYKEKLVQGWVVQPIMEEVWNGEYQMMFLNKELIYSQKKEYLSNSNNIPNQKDRKLIKYIPNTDEINKMKNLINYFETKYNFKLDICRIDFLKDDNNIPILLEFEMVNPGFFIGYMEKDDDDIVKIINKIIIYCQNYINNKE